MLLTGLFSLNGLQRSVVLVQSPRSELQQHATFPKDLSSITASLLRPLKGFCSLKEYEKERKKKKAVLKSVLHECFSSINSSVNEWLSLNNVSDLLCANYPSRRDSLWMSRKNFPLLIWKTQNNECRCFWSYLMRSKLYVFCWLLRTH